MGEHFVDGVDEFRMIDEGLPVIGGCDRNRTFALHTLNDFDKFGRGMLMPQIGFIAHHQTGDVVVAPRQIERGCNLALVSSLILIDPDAERNGEPKLAGDLRNHFQALRRSIGAHRLGVRGNRGEVAADLRLGYFQAVRSSFGKPVVGDAWQLAFDRGCGGIGVFQRPERKMHRRHNADDHGESAQ